MDLIQIGMWILKYIYNALQKSISRNVAQANNYVLSLINRSVTLVACSSII